MARKIVTRRKNSSQKDKINFCKEVNSTQKGTLLQDVQMAHKVSEYLKISKPIMKNSLKKTIKPSRKKPQILSLVPTIDPKKSLKFQKI